jgi:hypothetical protein
MKEEIKCLTSIHIQADCCSQEGKFQWDGLAGICSLPFE